jgi:ABC-type branched-subunit amino acid transport system substrate-binding protein
MFARVAALIAALFVVSGTAVAQSDFRIGVVASLTGGFASASTDENAGVQAWVKPRGLAGRKIVFETLDDETNPVNAINAFRKVASDPSVTLIYALTNSNSAMAKFNTDDTNFTPQIVKIKAADPKLIYNGATGRPGILTFKLIKQMQITAPLAVQQAAVSKALFDAIGGPDEANGVLTPSQIGAFGTVMGGDTAKLYSELQQALGRTPVYLNTFGYDVALITEAAVKNSDGSRQGIRDAIEKLKDLPAVNGPVTFSPQDHTGQDYRSLTMAKLEHGVLTPAD